MTDSFIKNLFSLSPRPFGDMGEEIVKMVIPSLSERKDHTHDASENGKRVEIKCSRALLSRKVNCLQDLLIEDFSVRAASLDQIISEGRVDCIFEHIKTRYFDDLYYSIFTSDMLLVFKISSTELIEDKNITFCNRQTRDAEGDGQFHVKKNNIEYHIKKYLVKEVTYDKLCDIIISKFS